MKTLLKNGVVVDGSGSNRYQADVLIDGDKIVKIGKIDAADGAEVIDVTGLVVAPGFIDTHSHSDLQILVDPEVRPKVMQGITTEILGQDGISMAPLPEKYISPWRKNLAGLDGDSDQVNYHYRDTAGYLKMIDDVKPGPNECYLVPHGNVRMEAMGLDNRQPTDEELQKMKDIVRREMEMVLSGFPRGLSICPVLMVKPRKLLKCAKLSLNMMAVLSFISAAKQTPFLIR